MQETRCPGQDLRNWKPDDICFIPCPFCKNEIEFWKDEPFRICSNCKNEIQNPRMDLSCATWCGRSKDCLKNTI